MVNDATQHIVAGEPRRARLSTRKMESTLGADAREPTGWCWAYVGSAALAPIIPLMAPQPAALTPAALKDLQTKAETNAREEARAEMDGIAGFICPSGCKKQVDLDKNFFDEPYWVGKPRAELDSFDAEFVTTIPMVIHVRTQVWVQDAEQKYHVHFVCKKPRR